ncbi:1-acyl-sn-glycerol-3-phosphate acyltransferase [Nocardiopsis terrae]|uniref:1-acyl-sn-glycerol-3-phosphate acyltransferase n=1 Tax=Nocardiopsis terrae TaxID=372655 RepID=A0ABR9HG17_9ACTN|nr:lysophospholipid acyltransferase family protein [Nocardiopsis terrae]MBE1457969.1 1-acyl-sn-glycerol-3-phosphate acyltransferase [Nocardiopsis terrae]GHC83273.1 1-acyl-sn-glycerol-3-phosphate acyltransferase [Nocardiopsis terrae]
MSLYGAAKAVVAPASRVAWPQKVEGTHHVPAQGPVILAANHLALIDPLFIGVACPRPVRFIAKQELFDESTLPRKALSRVLRALGPLSVDRRPGQSSQEAMNNSLEVITGGEVFGIFPEGTRSPDGRLYKGQTGLAWLALTTGAPVVPVALAGTGRILPPGRRIPSLNRVGVRFGEPVDLSPWAGQAGRAKPRREATDAIMSAIAKLSGQEQVSRYAASVKAELEQQ